MFDAATRISKILSQTIKQNAYNYMNVNGDFNDFLRLSKNIMKYKWFNGDSN